MMKRFPKLVHIAACMCITRLLTGCLYPLPPRPTEDSRHMPKNYREPYQYPRCPHCGGEHWGQRFDECPFIKILADPNATEEERQNATATLEAHRAMPPTTTAPHGGQ